MPCLLSKIMVIYLCNFPLPCGYIFILYERFNLLNERALIFLFYWKLKKSCIRKTLMKDARLITLKIESRRE
ncbi:hypothetical protein F909_01453 [Acinetobacter sp. ANC 3929]|nr:hypothetical protein F909_01453 [Acinetobacter sp. ANC 3929]